MIRVPRKESQTIHPTQQLSGWALSAYGFFRHLIEQVEPCCFRLQSHEIGIFYFKIVFKGLTLFIDCFSPNDFDLTIV